MDIKDWGRKIKSAEYGELYQINVLETIGSMQYMHIFYTQGCNLNLGIHKTQPNVHDYNYILEVFFPTSSKAKAKHEKKGQTVPSFSLVPN